MPVQDFDLSLIQRPLNHVIQGSDKASRVLNTILSRVDCCVAVPTTSYAVTLNPATYE